MVAVSGRVFVVLEKAWLAEENEGVERSVPVAKEIPVVVPPLNAKAAAGALSLRSHAAKVVGFESEADPPNVAKTQTTRAVGRSGTWATPTTRRHPLVVEGGEMTVFVSGTNRESKAFVRIPFVDTTPEKILEAEANFKWGDDESVRATREPDLYPTRRAKNGNELRNLLALGSKATEKLMGRQTGRTMTEGGGGPTRR